MLNFNFNAQAGETPASVAQKRALVAQLMGSSRSPRTLGEGFAAIGDGLVANIEGGRAAEGEAKGMASAKEDWDNKVNPFIAMLTGQGGSPSAASYGAPATVPTGADAASIRAGLIERGLPEHVADGFLMNFQDESGLNPGINEQNPTVPGSRGGYGLYQLTGPRRVAYEQYAQQLGVDPSDVNAQLDFMMSELQGNEANAARAIFGTKDAGSAAAAIATNFLRPAKQHLDARVSRYTGGGPQAAPAAPVQVASLDPSIGMPAAPQQAQLPPIAPSQPQQVAQAAPMPPQAPPAAPPAPVQTAEGPSLQMLMDAASNPWLMANPGMAGMVNSLLEQEMQKQDPRYLQSLRAGDLGIQKSELELEALRNPQKKPIEVGGVLLDADTMEPIFDSRSPSTATVGNVVVDTRTGQPVYEGQPDPTSNMQDYEAYAADERAAGREPIGRLQYEQEVRKAGASNVTTNVGSEQTPGWKKIDETFAETYLDWNSGGWADTQKQLNQLGESLDILEKGGDVTGAIGMLPREMAAFFNPDGTVARENVEEVVQRSLREILGAQFTEKEGERLIARAFNPLLSPAENTKRAKRLLDTIQGMAESKQGMVDYFDQNGTLRGYQGKRVKPADIERLAEEFGEAPGEAELNQTQAPSGIDALLEKYQ